MPTVGPTDEILATLLLRGPEHGDVVAGVVDTAAASLGLGEQPSNHLATAARAVADAIEHRGFDDPDDTAIDVTVQRRAHRIVVQIDDEGLPFNYRQSEDSVGDAAVIARATAEGWVDSISHEFRGRSGNRTTLVRHLDPGEDIREHADPSEHDEAHRAPPASGDVKTTSRHADLDDVEGICRLTWRTYGPTYQHEEYYRPTRLGHLIESGEQMSVVAVTDDNEVVGHTALVLQGPDPVVVEAGRAMVDPRYRGHHLMRANWTAHSQWFSEHAVMAVLGSAVTAHTRSQDESRQPTGLYLGFLPPISFRDIDDTETPDREATLAGFMPVSEIPAQQVRLPERDAAMIRTLYSDLGLVRTEAAPTSAGPGETEPTHTTSGLDVEVHADLGHAVLSITEIGSDLASAVADRVAAIRRGGIEVVYADIALDDPHVSWGTDRLAEDGFIFSGIVPLYRRGIDIVRYQSLGSTQVDPDKIHLLSARAENLLAYVLEQRS